MPAKDAIYRCVACDQDVVLTAEHRCAQCGVSYLDPSASQVIQAEATLRQMRAQYDELSARWNEWREYRAQALEALRATAPQGWGAPADAVAVTDSPDPFELHPGSAPAADAIPAPVPTAVPVPTAASAMPRAPRRGSEVARKAMTAPALLGVAGASLLIAASIVFVALAWTVFTPVVRGGIVSSVAVMVAGIAWWLRRMDLTVSSGAVGVVAMGFAGTASLAFSRDSGLLGAFDVPTALVVTCLAGVALSRLKVQWVGSAAGLAFAGAAVGYTVAATSASGGAGQGEGSGLHGVWIWTVVGTLSAAALAWSHRWWRFEVARVATQWVAVVWAAVVGLGASVWVWTHHGVLVDAVIALLPLALLVVLSRFWPRLAGGPVAVVVTVLAPAAASTWGASVWALATAAAVAVALVLAVGPYAPRAMRVPLLVGLAPAYAVVAASSAVYSVAITVTRIIAGVYVPDTHLWAGVAALVAGLAVAQLRRWGLAPAWTAAPSIAGALMVVTGLGIVAFGVAESVGHHYHSSVAVAMSVGAALLLVVSRVWGDARAQWVSTAGAVVFALVAGGHGAGAIAVGELPWGAAVAVALLPVAVLVWRAWQAPWWGVAPAVSLLSADALVAVARGHHAFAWQAWAAVAAAAVLLWALHVASRGRDATGAGDGVDAGHGGPQRIRSWHGPAAVGAVPALVLGGGAVLTAVSSVVEYLTRGAVTGVAMGWVLASLATGLACAAVVRMVLPQGVRTTAGVAGSLAVLAAGGSAVFTAAQAMGGSHDWALPACGLAAAVIAALFVRLWRSRVATITNGVGVVVMGGIAGIHAATLIPASTSWMWPALVGLVAVMVGGVSARWWPQFTWGPTALVATALAAGLGARLHVGTGALTLSTAVAALLLGGWSIGRVRRALVPAAADAPTAPAASAPTASAPGAPRLTVWLMAGLAPALLVAGAAMVVLTVHQLTAGAFRMDFVTWHLSWWAVALVGTVVAAVSALARVAVRVAPRVARMSLVVAAVCAAVGVAVLSTVAAAAVTVAGPQHVEVPSWSTLAVSVTVVGAAVALWVTHRGPLLLGRGARRGLRIALVVWLTVLAIAVGAAAGPASVPVVVPAVAAAALCAALAALAWRWPSQAMAPVMLATTVVVALLLVDRVPVVAISASVAAVVAGAAWLVRGVRGGGRIGALLGLLPALTVTVGAVVVSAIRGLLMVGDGTAGLAMVAGGNPWYLLTVAALAVAALAIPWARRNPGTVLVLVVMASWGMMPALIAAVALVVAVAATVLWGRVLRGDPATAAIALVVAMGLAWAHPGWALAVGVGTTVTVLTFARMRTDALHQAAVVVAPLPAVYTALAVVDLAGVRVLLPAVCLAAAAAVAWAIARAGDSLGRKALPWQLGVWTGVLMCLAPRAESRAVLALGLLFLTSAVAWLAARALGVRGARWWCAALVAVGTACVAAFGQVNVIEAYTAVPALAALLFGVQWLRANTRVRSLAALWPGLTLALVPSFIALMVNPDALLRTALLTLAIVVLAGVGVATKWFAPILATAVTAVVVSALQIIVGSNLVVRLVSFVVVGSLLLAVASWFEKLKALR